MARWAVGCWPLAFGFKFRNDYVLLSGILSGPAIQPIFHRKDTLLHFIPAGKQRTQGSAKGFVFPLRKLLRLHDSAVQSENGIKYEKSEIKKVSKRIHSPL